MGRAMTAGAIKSIQSGTLTAAATSTTTSPDTSYYDVTINAVDMARCVLTVDGGFGTNANWASSYPYAAIPLIRFLSSTSLRIYCTYGSQQTYFYGRWTVIEYY